MIKQMQCKIQKRSFWFYFLCIYALMLIILHTMMQMDIFDDAATKTLSQNYTVFSWVIMRYQQWSARFIQEGSGFLLIWHPLLWKIADTIIMFTIPLLLNYILDLKEQERFLSVALFLLYPIADMASAGWICTTNTYLWPVFFGLCVCALIQKNCVNGKLKWYEYILLFLCLLIACDHELLAAFMALILLYSCVYLYKKKERRPIAFSIAFLLNIIRILFTLRAPGNASRSLQEAALRFPDYVNFSFAQKCYLGVTRVLNILACRGSAIFILFCIALAVSVFYQSEKLFDRLTSLLPVTFLLMQTTLLKHHVIPDTMAINLHSKHAIAYSLLAVIFLFCITYSLVILYKEDLFVCLRMLVVTFGGLATTFAMGFSPTIYASGFRTSIFTYFAFLYLTAVLLKNILHKRSVNPVTFQWIMASLCVIFWGSQIISIYAGF